MEETKKEFFNLFDLQKYNGAEPLWVWIEKVLATQEKQLREELKEAEDKISKGFHSKMNKTYII